MDIANNELDLTNRLDDGQELVNAGLNPFIAVMLGSWCGLVTAAATSYGLKYLQRESPSQSIVLQCLAWAMGAGIGTALAACLVKRSAFLVGAFSSLLPAGIWLAVLPLLMNSDEAPVSPSVFGHALSIRGFFIGFFILTIIGGLVGAAIGAGARDDEEIVQTLRGIRYRHWFWLWIALYAWVTMTPTVIYFLWLEVIGSGYMLIHPSLWFSKVWTSGWTFTFGMGGIAALMYGIDLSLRNVSTTHSESVHIGKRVLMFLLGTAILAGPVSNILLRLAIHSLKHLPDGITAHPWWVLK
jgi:hypothetical protein